MKSEVRENQVLQQTPSEGETLTGIVEVIPDVFTDLWVRYGDGSWRWVDLTLLAETQGFQTLRDLKLFRQARISRSKLAIEWPGGLRLSVQGLVGASNELNDENVYVRAVSDTAYGWFRPLMVSVPRRVERKHLPTQVREKGLSDFEVLEWLGFSRAQLQRVLGAYPRREEVSMTRLLDLVMYLTGPTRAGFGWKASPPSAAVPRLGWRPCSCS